MWVCVEDNDINISLLKNTLFLLHIDDITSDGNIGKIAFPRRRQTGHLNSSFVTSYACD